MKKIDSDALGVVGRALGITGALSALTEFIDEQLNQVLDITPLVRRGRTIAQSEGLFYGILSTIHPGAGTLVTFLNPFNAAVFALNGWPTTVNRGFDIWLVSASVRQLSGTGTFTGSLSYVPPASMQGFGRQEPGGPAPAARAHPMVLAFWDSLVTQTDEIALANGGQPWQKIGLRLRRMETGGQLLQFSSTASALATFDCFVLMYLGPVGLGQDFIT